ncbi:MAG TPA: peptidoglycan DD-metalloendopeptidase family protein [Candidatus Paceibacterota bacterium]|nr:peptidoglycan DD-metalloendopeptidase family protein [Candidatus Paceibacterota bacterium]
MAEKPLFYKLLSVKPISLFLALSFFLGSAAPAHAGVLSDILGLFGSASAEVKETISDNNSQTASLLKPMTAVLVSAEGETPIVEDSALMSDSGPMGTIADVEYLTPADNKIEVYVVKKGDSLSSIAKMFGVSSKTIMWANDIANEKSLKLGQTLVILPISGVKHTIKKGDTVQSIAKTYGGDVEEILKYNYIDAKDKLVVGDTVIIPDGDIKTVVSKSSSGNSSRVAKNLPSYAGYYIKPAVNVRRTQGLHGNNGIDFAPYSKTSGTEPIYAAASGNVIIARTGGWNGGYGNMIVISHSNGTQTLYGHCYNIFVNQGEYVEQGQIIGFIGNTGKSTGPHLHFEVRGARNPF